MVTELWMEITEEEQTQLGFARQSLLDDLYGKCEERDCFYDIGFRTFSKSELCEMNKRLTDLGLLEVRDKHSPTPSWRITRNGLDTLDTLRRTHYETTDAARYRAEAVQGIRATIFNTLKDHVQPIAERCDETSPILGMLEFTGHFISHLKERLKRNESLEAALLNRDRVQQHAADMLIMATEDQSQSHAQKNGAMKLIASYLRRYIGQRNGTDVPPEPTRADDIPF